MNTLQKNVNEEKNSADSIESDSNVILPFEKAGEYFVERLGDIPKKPVYDFFKRTFDICSSGIALIIMFIPMIIIAVAIKCASKGTIFYTQERLGLNGKKIQVIKFRSMHMNAEANGL